MFSLREFIKNGFKDAVGKMADYQIILNASAYYEKGVLLEEDLAEIQELIIAKNTVENTVEEIENIEENTAEEVQEETTETTTEVDEVVENAEVSESVVL